MHSDEERLKILSAQIANLESYHNLSYNERLNLQDLKNTYDNLIYCKNKSARIITYSDTGSAFDDHYHNNDIDDIDGPVYGTTFNNYPNTYAYTKAYVPPKPIPPTEAEEAANLIKQYFSLTDGHGLYNTDSEEIISETIPPGVINTNVVYQTEKCFSRMYADGSKVFWIKRKNSNDTVKHNLHGPAVIFDNQTVEYWINGYQFSETNFNLIQNGMILK